MKFVSIHKWQALLTCQQGTVLAVQFTAMFIGCDDAVGLQDGSSLLYELT